MYISILKRTRIVKKWEQTGLDQEDILKPLHVRQGDVKKKTRIKARISPFLASWP